MQLLNSYLQLEPLNHQSKEEILEFILNDSDFAYLIKEEFLPCLQMNLSLDLLPSKFFKILENSELKGLMVLKHISNQHLTAELLVVLKVSESQEEEYFKKMITLALDYAFTELNLYRLELNVLENNSKMIKTYKKIGFKEEGLQRGKYFIENKHLDVYMMSLLQFEWERLKNKKK